MIRVFLDANVVFSASNRDSNIARLIHRLLETDEVITSDFAAEEARRNIQVKRPTWAIHLQRLLHQIQVVPSSQFNLPVELSEKDQPILCTAIRSQCQYLATDDRKDFGHLYDQIVEGITIISLAKLAEVVASPHT